MIPPLKQHRVANQLEPGREDQARIVEHDVQLVLRHPARVTDFVCAGREGDGPGGRYEEYVVDWRIALAMIFSLISRFPVPVRDKKPAK